MKTRRVGDHALLVLVDDARAAVAARELVLEIAGRRGSGALASPVEVVPAARTVLLDGLPGGAAVEAWRARLADESAEKPAADRTAARRRSTTIDVTYDGADLDVVAEAWSCGRDAVVDRHQATEYLVAFCGFAPGFAYCVPTDELPQVPRRLEPREQVRAGSVALAGGYCGVYPADMPGGWQLIGTTAAVLFDAGRGEPALLAPGDSVRFLAVR